jgi:APA family basic amino acid/polyamine antiporter
VNCLAVTVGGRVQSVLTAIKVSAIAAVILGIFFFSKSGTWAHLATPAGAGIGGVTSFGAAMLAALWAYDGWSNMPMVAGEVREPGRNVPRALIRGMLVVMLIYCAANLAYFYALDFDAITSSSSTRHHGAPPVAARAVETAFGATGGRFIAAAFVLSALGALHSSVMTGARIPYAMARDGLFPAITGRLHPRTHVPAAAVGVQGIWACVLAASGTFDQLTDYVVFALWIFYGLVASSVFVLRRKRPQAERPYRTFGYPVVPLLFVLVALWLVLNTLAQRPIESLTGLVLIALGWPLRILLRRKQSAETAERRPALVP